MITLRKARKALKAVVKKAGADYNYGNEHTKCVYANQAGEPKCIVGHVLAKLDPEALRLLHEQEATKGYSPGLGGQIGSVADRITPVARDYLGTAQRYQDERDDEGRGVYTWGEALRAAEASVK